MNSTLRTLSLCLILTGVSIGQAAAQCSSAPTFYAGTCTELQNYLNSFQATLNSQWNGQKPNVLFSGETLTADANRGLQGILNPQTYNSTLAELNADALLGMRAITIAMGFPLLYQQFYSFQGMNPADFNNVVSFYQSVVNEAHKRGLKVVVESSVMFPNVATDLPLKAYYATLSESDLTNGRAQAALTIAQQIKPDFINLGSEPDTQSVLLGLSTEFTPQQYATDISTILTTLRASGIKGTPLIGAGVGTWQTNATSYIQSLLATDLDYIDFHIYSVNLGFLTATPGYIDMVHEGGKQAAISEAWMKKLSDEQLQGKDDFAIIQTFSSAQTQAADAYSFWAPLDAQFITELVDLAYWKSLLYISPFPVNYFFAYIDYNQSANMTDSQVQQQATLAATTNMANGTLSASGQAYATAIVSATPYATVSAASFTSLVAANSIVSIFGPNLASGNAYAPSIPLPTSMENVSVTVTDNRGTQVTAPLFFVGPDQVNAVIPPGVNTGLIALTVNTPSGGQTSAVKASTVAPALFAAGEDGKGVAAAQIQVGNTMTNVSVCSGSTPSCSAVPINVTGGNTYLVLYGTGIRNQASQSDVTVQIGSHSLPVSFAGAAPGYVGLDQINVLLPSSLAGSGNVDVTVTVAGAVSNGVTVDIQ